MVSMQDKYLGCLLGAAAGDAMGAPTENKSNRQIRSVFGKRVTDFKNPPADSLARGRKKGQVTDAFSIPYLLTEHLLAAKGQVSRRIAEEALLDWGKSEWFEPFAGMTTRKVINRLNKEEKIELWSFSGQLGNTLFKSHYYALSSNGAAVKAYPLALLNGTNIDAAVADTVEATMASHDDPLSISGACAVTAAICTALTAEPSIYDITQAALDGAKRGAELAREQPDIWIYPGPSVVSRLEMAIEIAVHYQDEAAQYLADIIGCGPAIAETVPTAFGLLIARNGNIIEALFDAVNIGDETTAVASLVGAIGGAFAGQKVFPAYYLPLLEEANGFNLVGQAQSILALQQKRLYT